MRPVFARARLRVRSLRLTSAAAAPDTRAMTQAADPGCRLYLVTPPALPDLDSFARNLELALGAGDAAAVQLRLKAVDDAEVARAARRLRPLIQGAGAAAILNDRPDLAAQLGFDGVHVGQEDAPYHEARRIMGRERTVGVTCHDSRHLAFEAAEAGADYVAFGAFHPSDTKAAVHRAELELLEGWRQGFTTPSVAIGGITAATARALARAGADFLAVSAGVWAHPDGPAAAVRALEAEMAAGSSERT